jgi:beta-galactosidase
VSIPQLAGQLTLNGRDSKIHVTDYDVGGISLRYSTAEIFTWATDSTGKTTLLLYGDVGEWHEFAVSQSLGKPIVPANDSSIILGDVPPVWIIKWQVKVPRRIVRFEQGKFEVHEMMPLIIGPLSFPQKRRYGTIHPRQKRTLSSEVAI